MDCQEFEELSGAYALGALTPEEQQRADEHLAQCARCHETYRELQAVVELLPLTVYSAGSQAFTTVGRAHPGNHPGKRKSENVCPWDAREANNSNASPSLA
ncbi:MAG TPA: zf-HC2 domain-containing protein [Ktedonobacteraceae bacterium]|jgi:anti-sigma factor RsiW|nr:zf-HC2 domain-containing protein [Ktedonobacteraceae bacterium]